MLLELELYILAYFLKPAIARIPWLFGIFFYYYLTSFTFQTLQMKEKVKTYVQKERNSTDKIIHTDSPAIPKTDTS